MKKLKDKIIKLWIYLSSIIVFLLTAFIFIYIFKKGIASLSKDFLLKSPEGLPLGVEGGIYPAIIGSLYLMTLACLFSSLLAIGTAIYINFYCDSEKKKNILHLIIQSIAGIPSIVLGLFGYTLFVLNLKLGRSLLSASLTLAIMIFPYIQVRVEKSISEIDQDLIKASYALGIPKYYTIRKLVLPIVRDEIVSSILMAGGFAIGAASPIMLTGGVLHADVPKSLTSPIMALPLHLYILINEGVSLENAYGTALVLIILLLILNGIALVFKKGRRS